MARADRIAGALCVLVFGALVLPQVCAADWPTYRADAARSGVTEESLRFPLKLRWVYTPSQPPAPAWEAATRAEARRNDIDSAPQPVVADGLVFFGSSADDTVRALDLGSGKLKWRFTTGGPVRFAPAIDSGRAYVASDDGWLYCLQARTGRPVWQFRGAPADDQLIGNGRMISRWPLRTGPVVRDGMVHVTAGMWPAEGVCVYGLDARTGEVLWRNDTSDTIWMTQPHGGAYALTGVAPQGYLAASEDVLLVPTGRAVPAGYDRRTGRLLYYQHASAKKNGGVHVVVDEQARIVYNGYRNQLEAYSLASGNRVSGRATGRVAVRILTARAGDVTLKGRGNVISASPAGTDKELWRSELDAAVGGIAVADGRLVVSTTAGTVHCFGGGWTLRSTGARVRDFDLRGVGVAPARDEQAFADVLEFVKDFRITKGFALVLGADDARLAERIAGESELRVIAVLQDEAKVAAERERLVGETALCGSRVSVHHLADLARLPYASYFANLVVVAGDVKAAAVREAYRVLRPCGGVLGFVGAAKANAGALVADARVPGGEVRARGGSQFVVRGKLAGAFDWDSEVSCDQRVRWPLQLLWFGGPGPARMADRHWGPPTPVPANGRYFVIGEHSVIGVDAYNGTELWSREIPRAFGRPTRVLSALSADAESVYLAFGKICYQLDARTGEMKKVYGPFETPKQYQLTRPQELEVQVPQGPRGMVTVAKVADGLELTLVTGESGAPTRDMWDLFFDLRQRRKRLDLYGPGVFQLVVDARQATCVPGVGPTHPKAIVTGKEVQAGTEVVVLLPWAELEALAGRRPADFAFTAALRSLRRGEQERKGYVFGDELAYVFNNGWPEFVLDASAALSARPIVGELSELPRRALVYGRLPVRTDDLRTQQAERIHPLTAAKVARSYVRAYGCGGVTSSATMDFFRSGTFGFYDLTDDGGLRNFGGAKPSCGISMVPALGLLIANEGSSRCTCSYNFQTSFALAPTETRRNEDWAVFTTESRAGSTVLRTALNLAAPGDRRDSTGTPWLAFPRPDGMKREQPLALHVPLHVDGGDGLATFRFDTDRTRIEGTDRPWVYGSGYRGLTSAVLDLTFYQPLIQHLSLQSTVAPRIDGRLDDACWDGTGRSAIAGAERYVYRLNLPGSAPQTRPGSVYLRHDDESLYVGCQRVWKGAAAGTGSPWQAKTRGRDAPVWQDDSFEICLTDAEAPRILHLGVSASGASYDALWDYRFDVPRMEGIVVDGSADDWSDGGFQVNLFGKGRCRLGWDERGLLLVTVTDKDFQGSGRMRDFTGIALLALQPGRRDTLELGISTRGRRWAVGRSGGQGGAEAAVQAADSAAGDSYVVEALFPWAGLGVAPEVGGEVGLPMFFYREDRVGPGSSALRDAQQRVLRSPKNICRLRLAEKPSRPPDAVYGDAFGGEVVMGDLAVTEDTGWDGAWTVAVRPDSGVLEAELRIPWSDLAGVGLQRQALLVKLDRRGALPNLPATVRRESFQPLLLSAPQGSTKAYTVRLHFVEPDDVAPGRRVFDVKLQGKTVARGLDISRAAGGRFKALVKEFNGIEAKGTMTIELVPTSRDKDPTAVPVISGIEVLVEQDGEVAAARLSEPR